MKIPVLFALSASALLLVGTPNRALGAPVPLQITPALNIEQNYVPTADAKQTNWQLTPRGASLPLSDGLPNRQRFILKLATPVPAGDWTLEFLISGRDDLDFVAAPEGRSLSETKARFRLKFGSGDLPVRWIQLRYDSKTQTLTGRANGAPIYNLGDNKISEGDQLGLSFTSYGDYGERTLKILDVDFIAGEVAVLPEPAGSAFYGWQAHKIAPVSPAVLALLDKLHAPGETLETRAYALSARLMADANAPLSPELWGQVRDLAAQVKITKIFAGKRPPAGEIEGARAVMLLLATATARLNRVPGDKEAEAQLTQLRATFDAMVPVKGGIKDEIFLARAGLISPARATQAMFYGDQRVLAAFVEDWVFQLKTVRPDLSLAATAQLIRHGGNNAFAWFLPQLREANPALYREVLEINARDPKNTSLITSGFDNIRDEMANKAVYRLAPVAAVEAAAFFDVMKTPKMRIEAVQFMAESGEGYAESVDEEFARAIAAFKPSQKQNSDASLWIERARYHARSGKDATANEFLERALQNAGTDFGTAGAIYRYLRDQKDARAAQWLEKWRLAAIAADKTEDEYGGGTYISATGFVVRELVSLEQFDNALALAQTLDKANFPSNRSNAFSSIAYGLALTDLPRALKIAAEVDETRRESVIVGIALKVAREDFKRGWALLDTVAPATKAAAALRFSPYAPPEYAPQMRGFLKQAIEDKLARPDHLRHGLAERNIGGLEKSAPEVLASLADSFAKDRTLLARDLFLSIGARATADSDPVWQRIAATEVGYGTSTEWSPTMLKDVQRSVESNAEKGLDFKVLALPDGR